MVLVDANVLLDVLTDDPDWRGAHAQTDQLSLLTRDATRYRTYFPKVKLIAPE